MTVIPMTVLGGLLGVCCAEDAAESDRVHAEAAVLDGSWAEEGAGSDKLIAQAAVLGGVPGRFCALSAADYTFGQVFLGPNASVSRQILSIIRERSVTAR